MCFCSEKFASGDQCTCFLDNDDNFTQSLDVVDFR